VKKASTKGNKKGGKGKGEDDNKNKKKQKPVNDDDENDVGSGDETLSPARSINVRHILCEKYSKKEEALAKLRDGAKFNEVAEEFSEDKARQGGLLGWKRKDELLEEFATVAFKTPASSCTNPIWKEAKTEHGYHIIMVEGRKK